VVRRARRDLATQKATTNTADHGVHGGSNSKHSFV